nr:RNA-directed DNA polymerase, eukaryota [Tanacetum cinerariifolium]
SLGSSGGILCIWESSIFKKDYVTISDNFIAIYALYLDRHLSDHRPILLREILLDFGPTPFRFYHSWFSYDGFDEMVKKTWRSFSYSDTNRMIRFKKKLQELKSSIRLWVKDKWANLSSLKYDIVSELCEIDKELDSGLVLDDQLARRLDLKGQLYDINDKEVSDRFQKSKVRWAIEGDDNSSFFHGIINKKRSQLAIRGILVDASWQSDPQVVKEVFRNHFAARFKKQNSSGPKINYSFPNRLSQEQVLDLEREVLHDEIRLAVWSCGDNKSSEAGIFKGIRLNSSLSLSHLFYADDALIIGLQINFHKSQLLGVGAARPEIKFAASSIGCTIMENQFRYLGVTVGGNMSRCKAWSDIVSKLRSLLSKWKTKTLSIGGRLTLLKSVLGASPLYCMSIFKAPKDIKLRAILESVSLSHSHDRWICNASSDGSFRVKDIRNLIDDLILPSRSVPTKWMKYVPIKINIFVWRARRDCLPSRENLMRRGVVMESTDCSIYCLVEEDVHHILLQCNLAHSVLLRICRWWDIDWQSWSFFHTWDGWFSSIKIAPNNKKILEGVFYRIVVRSFLETLSVLNRYIWTTGPRHCLVRVVVGIGLRIVVEKKRVGLDFVEYFGYVGVVVEVEVEIVEITFVVRVKFSTALAGTYDAKGYSAIAGMVSRAVGWAGGTA